MENEKKKKGKENINTRWHQRQEKLPNYPLYSMGQ
jgi:hypothetical protein